ARRKRNTVELLGRSSYGIGREHARSGSSLEASMGLPTRDYAKHGGAFPIALADGTVIGVVTVSGLPQREDHAMVVEVLAGLCGAAPADLALG
uniref:heme-binding protein n=1 Tax=Pelomonas sp. KK5 TaxID=1855730 RepID=UPI0018EA072A